MKFLSWSIALGSGTSGGTLAPLMTLGSGLGLMAGVVAQVWVPTLDVRLAALAGMACVFGGASQAVLASAVFACETTGQSQVLFPVLAACAVTLLVVRALGRTSIMTEKIERRGVRVPSEFGAEVFAATTVSAVMETDVMTVAATTPLDEFARRVSDHDPSLGGHHAHPVVDDAGGLVGIVTRGDLVRVMGESSPKTILDAATPELVVAHPDESLQVALEKLLVNDIGRLPVVDPADPRALVGYLSRSAILSAHRQVLLAETANGASWTPWRSRRGPVPPAPNPETH